MSREFRFEYIHDQNIHRGGCNKPAFNFCFKPKPNSTIRSTDAQLLDGRTPVLGDPIHCGSCGVHLERVALECIRKRRSK